MKVPKRIKAVITLGYFGLTHSLASLSSDVITYYLLDIGEMKSWYIYVLSIGIHFLIIQEAKGIKNFVFEKYNITDFTFLFLCSQPFLITYILGANNAGRYGHGFTFISHILLVTIHIQARKRKISIERTKSKIKREREAKLSRTLELLSTTGNSFFIKNYALLKYQTNDMDIFDILSDTNKDLNESLTLRRINAGISIFKEGLNIIALNHILSQENLNADIYSAAGDILKQKMNNEIKELMFQAIEEKRPHLIEKYCLNIWNQPFFYKIDKAKVLTISYSPTDQGAKNNYPDILDRYQKMHDVSTEEIFNLLYDFKIEKEWRKNYNLIFQTLGFSTDEIAHMDESFYPYSDFEDYCDFRDIDTTDRYLIKTIRLLKEQLKIIFIDGNKNRDILYSMLNKIEGFVEFKSTQLPVNSRNASYDLLIYKHREIDLYLIYYGCSLYGNTRPNEQCVERIAEYIKSNLRFDDSSQSNFK